MISLKYLCEFYLSDYGPVPSTKVTPTSILLVSLLEQCIRLVSLMANNAQKSLVCLKSLRGTTLTLSDI